MSWFNLIAKQKSILDSNNLLKNAFNGTLHRTWILDRVVKSNTLYHRTSNAAATNIIHKLTPAIAPLRKEISTKLLEKAIKDPAFTAIIPEMFEHYHLVAETNHSYHDNFITDQNKAPMPKLIAVTHKAILSSEGAKQMVHHFFDNHLIDEAMDLTKDLKKSLYCRNTFTGLIQKAIVTSLKPHCENALNIGIEMAIRLAVDQALETCCEKMVTIITLPLIYGFTLFGFEQISEALDQEPIFDEIPTTILNLSPSKSTLMWSLTTFQVIKASKAIFDAHRKSPSETSDKADVKILFVELTKTPLMKALKESLLLRNLKVPPSDEKVEALAKWLIEETIDLYWAELVKIKFLKLPLFN